MRVRPAMYIGSTGESGLHHLVYEVVDNSVDEALAGYCTRDQRHHPHRQLGDRRRQRPRHPGGPHPTVPGMDAAEVVLTKLHAGGKFDKKSYKVSGGLHGVGISVVNALSETLEVEIWRDKQGLPPDLPARRARRARSRTPASPTGAAPRSRFKPDAEIFETTVFSFDTLSQRLRELSFLNRGIVITLDDERDGQEAPLPVRGRHRLVRAST